MGRCSKNKSRHFVYIVKRVKRDMTASSKNFTLTVFEQALDGRNPILQEVFGRTILKRQKKKDSKSLKTYKEVRTHERGLQSQVRTDVKNILYRLHVCSGRTKTKSYCRTSTSPATLTSEV